MAKRTCTECGADITHKAKSALTCTTKCSKRRDARRQRAKLKAAATPQNCEWCRTGFTPAPRISGTTRFCSYACGTESHYAHRRPPRRLPVIHPNPDPPDRCDLPRSHPVVRWAKRPTLPNVIEGNLRIWTQGTCPICGDDFCRSSFVMDRPAGYCSRKCGGKAARERRRATLKNAYVADVNRKDIYERDGWCCQLCGKAVKRDAEVPHPKAPTIDHIIPLADGGTHEPKNAQLAHFLCNAIKGAGVPASGDQLRLI